MTTIRRHITLLLALLVALGACTDAAAPDVTAAPTPSPTASAPARPAPEATESADDPGTVETTQPCGEPLLATLVATVDGQLDAIVTDDWATALGFASMQFREGTDVAGFEQVIEQDFPVVADAAARDVGGCRVGGEEASLGVVVEDADGNQQALLYLFQHDPDGWAIAGAVPAGGSDSGPGSDEGTITA